MRELLEAVAAGTISPDEATARINQLQDRPTGAPQPEPVKRIIIKGGAVKLTVIGDSSVAEAVADGPHQMQHDGDALLITTQAWNSGQYTTEPPRSAFMGFVSHMVDRVGRPLISLTVRVNPNLPLQVLVVGGTLELKGARAGASIGVEAGSATIVDGYGPLLLDVSSGSAKVDWTFTGESKIKADMGSANVYVRQGSDVKIVADTSLGQALIKTHTGNLKAPQDGSTSPVVVGEGNGTLAVTSRMGSAQVTVA